MTTIQLGRIDIGGGVVATQAWLSNGGPIVLIATTTNGHQQNSRLDVQKAMFIDPLPGARSVSGVNDVVKAVRQRS